MMTDEQAEIEFKAGNIQYTELLMVKNKNNPSQKKLKKQNVQSGESKPDIEMEDYIGRNVELIVSPQGHKALYLGFDEGNQFIFNGQKFSMTTLGTYLRKNKISKSTFKWHTEDGIVPDDLWEEQYKDWN